MENKQQEIHQKGFDMTNMSYQYGGPGDAEFNKIKVGVKTLDDAILTLGDLQQKGNRTLANKNMVLQAINDNDVDSLRQISNYFYKANGLYQKVCHYFAFLYRYDWYIVPDCDDKVSNNKQKAITKTFYDLLKYLDNSNIKQLCGEITLEVIKSGSYYGYILDQKKNLAIQQLPAQYCRSRYKVGTNPAVEFNMRYFDEAFQDVNYRMRVLNLFPKEFAKGYLLYKQGKLQPDIIGERGSWYLLDPEKTVKFSFYSGQQDIPMFVNAIPAIINLDEAQELDRRKQMQKLLKILVQKLPRDKNGDLIFDVEEAKDIHNNAVQMLKRAVGIDVITTFADIESIDTSDRNTTTTKDDLEKVERTVYNDLGISQNLFNTSGNLSLEKSILQDEATVRNLLLQFNAFFNRILDNQHIVSKKQNFTFYMLETTQYNYKELSKMYKEQVQIGYSKMLPQIALGHSQSSIIHTAYFENNILHLQEVMIPNLMSSTMSSEQILGINGQKTTDQKQNITEVQNKAFEDEKGVGRPEKKDDEKSEKTIRNQESMS